MSVRLAIITISAAAALIGLVISLWANRLPVGPRKTELNFLGAIFMGWALVCYGACTAILIHRANHITLVGTLTDLQLHNGKSRSMNFLVTGEDGAPVRLTLHSSTDYLADLQQVSVTYVEGFGTVTHLQVLPHGFEAQESDGSLNSLFFCALGVVLFFRTKR